MLSNRGRGFYWENGQGIKCPHEDEEANKKTEQEFRHQY